MQKKSKKQVKLKYLDGIRLHQIMQNAIRESWGIPNAYSPNDIHAIDLAYSAKHICR